MSVEITLTVTGLDDLQEKLDAIKPALQDATEKLLTNWGIEVEARAKVYAPVDTGRLRASLTHTDVEVSAVESSIKVGTDVYYGPFAEYGTRPHWAPTGVLQPWAQRHGFGSGAAGDNLVRAIIAKYGTKAHPYLTPAFEDTNRDVLPGLVVELLEDIKTAFGAT